MTTTNILALAAGWLADLTFGDPERLPHPVVGFGKLIAQGERLLNQGRYRTAKGALLAVGLIALVYGAASLLRRLLGVFALFVFYDDEVVPLRFFVFLFDVIAIFYCLAGTTLIREVRQVFLALDRSLSEGRRQVARIVGRDTSELSAQEVRQAALETLAENLSDGVIAPLFWLALFGTPGMLAYKMVNTLDSMIGYKTARYREFGCWAARIDDLANYLPARLTALLMIAASAVLNAWPGTAVKAPSSSALSDFVLANGRRHASPNSGYPEAALAGILDCQFGGPHYYFGQLFDKPYIGTNNRELTTADMLTAVRINRTTEVLMVVIVSVSQYLSS